MVLKLDRASDIVLLEFWIADMYRGHLQFVRSL